MRKNFSFLLAAFLLLAGRTTAQQHRICGANEVLLRQLQEDPSFRQRLDAIEAQTNLFIQSGGAQDRTVVTIPVVVHVVWNLAVQNVSDAQIQSQIDVLNADFRKLNGDVNNTPAAFAGLAADCELNFCMAARTPSGAATNGIERRQTTTTAFGTNDNVKHTNTGGLDAWDATKYLNLWVCKLSGGVLGYAQFPGGPLATDGVVITYTGFGTIGTATAPFHLGRTATHEVGHWVNLYHIWGDDGTGCNGSDNCADTPNQADENYGCPVFPAVSCTNGPNGDMFMNYMDYTDDACMFMFTTGQKGRMQPLFLSGGSRYGLVSSLGCTPPSGGGSCDTPAGLTATSIAQTSATLNWGAVSGATSYNLQWKLSSAGTFTTVSGLSGTSYNLSGLTASTSYDYQVQAVCSGTPGSYSAASSFITLASGGGGCADVYEPNNTNGTAAIIPVNTAFTAQIASSTDKDYYKFANTSTTRNIKVDLTTLPFDYDLKLYRNTALVGTSQNGGTLSEQLIYNTNNVSTSYIAYVYGYSGAFSTTQCYTLKASLSSSNWRNDGSTDGQVEEIELPVQFENAGFGMFPNPATSQLTVEVPMEAETDVQVSIVDPSGRAALQQHRTLSKGDNQMLFDVHNLPNGVYFVQVRNGEQVSTRKLVVNK
ncbi:MAG: T9SS type A sorting domain-containing protein [Saprospiraceae bacterium]